MFPWHQSIQAFECGCFPPTPHPQLNQVNSNINYFVRQLVILEKQKMRRHFNLDKAFQFLT